MGCEAPVRECLQWHYAEHLAHAKATKGGLTIQARCPAHDRGRESLTISAGTQLRVVWYCHAGCDGSDVRRAMIRVGVPEDCVPRGDGTEQTLADIAIAALCDGSSHAIARLRALAILSGHTTWPKGRELTDLAAAAHIHEATAYRAIEAGPLMQRPNSSTYAAKNRSVKDQQVSAASRPFTRVAPCDKSHHATSGSRTMRQENPAPQVSAGADAAAGICAPNKRGRPAVPVEVQQEFRRRCDLGESPASVAVNTGRSVTTVRKYLRLVQ